MEAYDVTQQVLCRPPCGVRVIQKRSQFYMGSQRHHTTQADICTALSFPLSNEFLQVKRVDEQMNHNLILAL